MVGVLQNYRRYSSLSSDVDSDLEELESGGSDESGVSSEEEEDWWDEGGLGGGDENGHDGDDDDEGKGFWTLSSFELMKSVYLKNLMMGQTSIYRQRRVELITAAVEWRVTTILMWV